MAWQEAIESDVRTRCDVAGVAVDLVEVGADEEGVMTVSLVSGAWSALLYCGHQPDEFSADKAATVASIAADQLITAARAA
jgi:hypothetical protein